MGQALGAAAMGRPQPDLAVAWNSGSNMKASLGSAGLACVLVLAGTSAGAALPEPEPGLWQIKPEVRMNGRDVTNMMGALQAQLMAQLPAEQRERLPPVARQPLQETRQVCVSSKDAGVLADPEGALAMWGKELDKQGCSIGNHAVSGNTVTFEGECRNDGKVFQGEVEGELVYHSSRRITGKVLGNGVPGMGDWARMLQGAAQAAAQSLRTELTVDMQWQGTDCGNAPPTGIRHR